MKLFKRKAKAEQTKQDPITPPVQNRPIHEDAFVAPKAKIRTRVAKRIKSITAAAGRGIKTAFKVVGKSLGTVVMVPLKLLRVAINIVGGAAGIVVAAVLLAVVTIAALILGALLGIIWLLSTVMSWLSPMSYWTEKSTGLSAEISDFFAGLKKEQDVSDIVIVVSDVEQLEEQAEQLEEQAEQVIAVEQVEQVAQVVQPAQQVEGNRKYTQAQLEVIREVLGMDEVDDANSNKAYKELIGMMNNMGRADRRAVDRALLRLSKGTYRTAVESDKPAVVHPKLGLA